MAQRVYNLSKWQYLDDGKSLLFDSKAPRNVVIDVNCPEETRFFVHRDLSMVADDPERVIDIEAGREVAPVKDGVFLGLAKGRDRFEFYVEGEFMLEADQACWFSTLDSMKVAGEVIAPLIFTRVANRRQRNPHLEMMEYQMRRNMDAFAQAMGTEMERRLDAMQKGLERHAPQRNEVAPAGSVGRKARDEVRSGTDSSEEPLGQVEPDEGEVETGGKSPKPGKAAKPRDNVSKASKADR